MKLQIASDLHLEHIYDDMDTVDFTDLLIPSADILALAGDICTYDAKLLFPFLTWCSKNFQYVLWVPGNHEYYNKKGLSISDLDKFYQTACSQFSNVHYINNHTCLIDKLLFIGTTLWSYIPQENADRVEKQLNDYKYIYSKAGVRITVSDINRLYQTNLSFISQELETTQYKGYVPIVITHHAPAMKGTSLSIYENSITNCAFASDIRSSNLPFTPKLWVYGHTHYNSHHKLHQNGYELVSNQFGYEGEHDGLTYKFASVFDLNYRF
jgi:3',5'-cyclic AMP phosphodiesterase CpdA